MPSERKGASAKDVKRDADKWTKKDEASLRKSKERVSVLKVDNQQMYAKIQKLAEEKEFMMNLFLGKLPIKVKDLKPEAVRRLFADDDDEAGASTSKD